MGSSACTWLTQQTAKKVITLIYPGAFSSNMRIVSQVRKEIKTEKTVQEAQLNHNMLSKPAR